MNLRHKIFMKISNPLQVYTECGGFNRKEKDTKNPTEIIVFVKIEDDDNVCETVFIEINADNPDSFIDKVDR